jgi:hypothetical protein
MGRAHDGGLTLDVALVGRRLQDDRFRSRRNDAPVGAEETGGLVQALLDIPGGGHELGQDQVAEGMPRELVGLGLEAVLEDLRQQGVVVGQRHQALAQVAGWDDTHLAP